MSFDLAWTYHYCLACDRQTEGEAYCSESCRLSDNDRSTGSSQAPDLSAFRWPSSPSSRQTTSSAATAQATRPKFYLSPAYDFTHAEPYGSTPRPQGIMYRRTTTAGLTAPVLDNSPLSRLTPSSSHASLASLQSVTSASSTSSRQQQYRQTPNKTSGNNTTPDSLSQLSDQTRQELRAYALSFENGRLQRRRSY